MNAIRTATFAAALSLASAFAPLAQAMPAANVAELATQSATESAFLVGQSLFPGRPARLDRYDVETASAAAESYFDFDAVITLGALILGGAAVAGIGLVAARRKPQANVAVAQERDPSWHESVFLALQADLA